MKNRIIAITLILIIFISMIPISANAATTTLTATDENLKWEKATYNGNTYQISYYYPIYNGVAYKYFFFGLQGGQNITWFNDNTMFDDTEYRKITAGNVITLSIADKAGTRQPMKDFLYSDDYNRTNLKMSYYTATLNYVESEGITTTYCGSIYTANAAYSYYTPERYQTLDNITSMTSDSETYYADWYYAKYGTYPPIRTEEDEEIKYMNGNYYAIIKQAIQTTNDDGGGGGTSFDGAIDISKSGFVDTCEDVKIVANDSVYCYVVISTEKPSLDFFSLRSEGVWDYISDVFWHEDLNKWEALMEAEPWGEPRNNYTSRGHYATMNMIYSDTEYINRYYFKSLTDACKFTLYGTAGATPQHTEEGMTRYSYGFSDIVYNNYNIGIYNKATIPNDQYPLEKTQVLLEWHDENVAEREYLIINFDYFPLSSSFSSDKVLMISQQLNPTYLVAYKTEENEDTFNIRDYSLYSETDKYDYPKLQHFQIYYPGLDEMYVSNSWNLLFSKHSVYSNKYFVDEDGYINIESGSIFEDEATIQTKEDEEGNKYIYDALNDIYRKENEEDHPYTDPDGDGIYENDKGDTLDPSTLSDEMKEWRENLKYYTSSLSNASEIIDEFTNIINNSTEQMSQLTSLLNSFLSHIPTIYKTLIFFSVLSFILIRIIRRK